MPYSLKSLFQIDVGFRHPSVHPSMRGALARHSHSLALRSHAPVRPSLFQLHPEPAGVRVRGACVVRCHARRQVSRPVFPVCPYWVGQHIRPDERSVLATMPQLTLEVWRLLIRCAANPAVQCGGKSAGSACLPVERTALVAVARRRRNQPLRSRNPPKRLCKRLLLHSAVGISLLPAQRWPKAKVGDVKYRYRRSADLT